MNSLSKSLSTREKSAFQLATRLGLAPIRTKSLTAVPTSNSATCSTMMSAMVVVSRAH